MINQATPSPDGFNQYINHKLMTNKSLLTDSAVPSTHMPFSSDVKNDSSCFSFGSDPDPFPELSATCRGHDDALPADRALAAEDVIVTERPGWKEAYFQATRGVSQSVSQSVSQLRRGSFH